MMLMAEIGTTQGVLCLLVLVAGFSLWWARRGVPVATTDRTRKPLEQEISTRLDDKMAALGQLIRTARHEAVRLEAALERIPAMQSPDGSDRRTVMASLPDEFEPTFDAVPITQATGLLQAARGMPRGPDLPEAPPSPAAIQRPYDRIYYLADQGLDGPSIAAAVGTPRGEVELILGLRATA